MLIRQNAPVFGASNPYLEPGEWQINASFRGLRSDRHYRQAHHEPHRQELGTYVINLQRMLDIGATYAVSERLNLAFSVPYVNASWSIPLPVAPVPGPRSKQEGRGVGDITGLARYWALNPDVHRQRNFSVGFGLKLPTGQHDVRNVYPDLSGGNATSKVVDQSVQPGDGGLGLIFEGQAFSNVGPGVAFVTGTYLANPKNTSGAPSIIVGLGIDNPVNFDKLVNSVPDQYLVRAGAAMPVPVGRLRGLSVSGALRVEGLPRYDLIGGSNGFRRPGVAVFVEPGLSYSHGRSSWSFNVPVGVYFNRRPDPNTNILGDATFPEYIALGSYSIRFGGRQPAVQPLPTGPEAAGHDEAGEPARASTGRDARLICPVTPAR